MAVYAAHITRTLQGTPSVFQVTAQEALGATVKPALRKLVEYLAASYPNQCGWCVRWYDELFLLFDCCLQYHYLKHYAASFSESFYGLMRVPLSVSGEFVPHHRRLPASLERGSLALLVLLPYCRGKLEALVDRWREDHEDGRLGKGKSASLRVAAIKLYAICHFVYTMGRVVQCGRYLCGASRSPSVSLAALRLSLADAPDTEPPDWRGLATAILRGRYGDAVSSLPVAGGVVLRAVEYGAFAVQLARGWACARPHAAAALPAPPPPKKEERDEKVKNKCPICLQSWRAPTVLPVSGYIFCYACVSRGVRVSGACPVSRCPAREADLVRLYLD